ncbi:PREDICTED: galactoside 2-alpha-L-fucosyltransferase-like [Tarenaya hassleriana]|uniref:galactoside 2-alpha-L-fucosyltransferase-like n=1 Tax=Tarenaya hassleriana TaxID=28532 RepID=UPI00053C89D0|nr:PREDICTED: galactoside 2-alpha-L-fucosyltransferase-like [Tarenaya hassleriana]
MDPNPRRRRASPIKISVADCVEAPGKFLGSGTMKLTRTFTTCLILFSVLLAFSMIFRRQPSDLHRIMGFADARVLDTGTSPNLTTFGTSDSDKSDVKLLGGLLSAEFNGDSCRSRYQSAFYRKHSPYKPSEYLVSRLRNYEMLHKRCGPGTEAYKKALEQLDHEQVTTASGECKYVVWVSFSGLGNRILSLASVFLYALLTDRVLLVDRGKDLDDIFCEPFPGASWLLPLDFPLTGQFDGLNQESSLCYGNLLKNHAIDSSTEKVRPYLYLHLVHDYGDHDKMFFCEGDQSVIGKMPWLIVKTDNYFVPSLWLIPGLDQELSKLFPQKETIFHHLGRYLFHPTNQVWGLVTRYYEAYLSRADERIGIQIRVFDVGAGPFQHVMDQIVACTRREKLLPEVETQESHITTPQESPRLKAVLVTSLSSGYSENLKSIYWELPTSTGDIVGVYQPSQEGYQQTEKKLHNRKALAEMYLLSMTDKLVTSAWSTFGYVAQGLGGLKPWILHKPENRTAPDPPCGRAMSMEPCFHAPPFYDCKAKTGIDTGKILPHVRHCEDMSWGLKLVDAPFDI